MDGSRWKQVALVAVCLPGGLVLLWLAGSTTVAMIRAIQNSEPSVIVDRLAIAACGAGIGMLGAALVVIAGDFLKSPILMKWAAVLFIGGGLLTIALPLPISMVASAYLSESGYVVCRELTEPSFKLSRTAWVRNESTCRKSRFTGANHR